MLTLYQFPISHYCEKVRWSLDYKNIDYQTKNLLPGLHALKTSRIAIKSSVPIIDHEGRVIQGSSEIITYLDEYFPGPRLTPDDSILMNESLKWEQYVDEEIGTHLRRCLYHVLLEHPNIVIPFFAHNGPWYGRFFLKRVFPKLQEKMRKGMNINADSAKDSQVKVNLAIDKIYTQLQSSQYLVGNTFSRADLSAAALLAPLCRPVKYGLDWPEKFPHEVEHMISGYGDKLDWVDSLYADFR